MFICIDRAHIFLSYRVDIPMALSRSFNPIGPMQSCVEPLWAVGCRALAGDEVTHFIIVSPSIAFAGEVAVLPTPISPGSCESAEELPTIRFRSVTITCIHFLQFFFIGG